MEPIIKYSTIHPSYDSKVIIRKYKKYKFGYSKIIVLFSLYGDLNYIYHITPQGKNSYNSYMCYDYKNPKLSKIVKDIVFRLNI